MIDIKYWKKFMPHKFYLRNIGFYTYSNLRSRYFRIPSQSHEMLHMNINTSSSSNLNLNLKLKYGRIQVVFPEFEWIQT